jgi:hypothetical protein
MKIARDRMILHLAISMKMPTRDYLQQNMGVDK